jgi:hypothetical protein
MDARGLPPVRKEMQEDLDLLPSKRNVDPFNGIVCQSHHAVVASNKSAIEFQLLRMVIFKNGVLTLPIGLNCPNVQIESGLTVACRLSSPRNNLFMEGIFTLKLTDHLVAFYATRYLELLVLEILHHSGRLGEIVQDPLLSVAATDWLLRHDEILLSVSQWPYSFYLKI